MITACLYFNGNTEEAFNFYKSALGGKFVSLQRFSDTPHGEQMPETERNKIMHIMLEGPDGVKLMGNDYMSYTGQPFTAGNNFALTIHPDSEAKADQVFNALSAGGTVIVPIGKVFWGAYFGMFTDKFGIQWMVNHQ